MAKTPPLIRKSCPPDHFLTQSRFKTTDKPVQCWILDKKLNVIYNIWHSKRDIEKIVRGIEHLSVHLTIKSAKIASKLVH